MVIPVETYLVTAVESPEYELLKSSLARSSVVGLDAEWKPWSREDDGDEGTAKSSAALRSFPTVTLLQIACREATDPAGRGTRVFLVDLLALELAEFWGTLRDVFESPHVLKLGFRFKQDLIYLSSTFAAQGCHPGFDKVEPFMDITSVYYYLKTGCTGDGKRPPKQSESLATICKQVLGVVLSKELQCSDWSIRPLTDEQKLYAAADAYYLLEILDVFQCSFNHQGMSFSELWVERSFQGTGFCDNVLGIKFGRASDIVKSSGYALPSVPLSSESTSTPSLESTLPLDISLSGIVRKYGERILLQESERKPRTSKRKGRRQPSASWKSKDHLAMVSDWQGPPPWIQLVGGRMPKVSVEGLAKYLRCVGIDAAIPSVKKPEPRQLIEQAHKEKRVILTRDAKLLKHQYLIGNQVIETFQLKISEEQLMSRCSKCNGRFIQKPLSIEEAVAASKGFQVIPNCLFKRDLEFWQCMDCGQLYWEGTQYQNAVQRFTNVCKLTD
ncbi:unnamed protein product [Spirodela intermedia]|uniref:3'-5' exonuclease domain-containing protein n=1 Tax=Spirodela intermedia TaxID=51605 RepID=A0A7I8IF82_SPIIN|nr:unnamed protein product [Spirodela intermedia]CAA6656339.1 unnamed protein product [Spirodela intermedia]